MTIITRTGVEAKGNVACIDGAGDSSGYIVVMQKWTAAGCVDWPDRIAATGIAGDSCYTTITDAEAEVLHERIMKPQPGETLPASRVLERVALLIYARFS